MPKVADADAAEEAAAALEAAVKDQSSPASASKLGDSRLKSGKFQPTRVLNVGEVDANGLATIVVHGKIKKVCKRSLFLFSIDGCIRRHVLTVVEYRWFDRFILLCIVIGSCFMAIYTRRDPEAALNKFIDVVDVILLVLFTLECMSKIVAWGLCFEKKTYLRDPWNWLDFVVVVSGWVEHLPNAGDGGLGFLRLFRVLRPLRSLNAVPQMKMLVNTVISSVPRLGNVTVMGGFLFVVFGIIGITLMNGIFYRRCYVTPNPVLNNAGTCWSWADAEDERLCGGAYMCEDSGGYCRGLEEDPLDNLKAVFPGGRRGLPWCSDTVGHAMKKVMPETDFVHFDHLPAALLLIFQSMTLEGWTDLMYYVMDGYGTAVAWLYFVLVVLITSFFLLNVALAVVDEARADFNESDEAGAEEEQEKAVEPCDTGDALLALGHIPEENVVEEEPLWFDCILVRWCEAIASDEIFMNFIVLVIVFNVVLMMLHPPQTSWRPALDVLNPMVLIIFVIEMIIMLIAKGPKGYVMNPVTAFDGLVVVVSIIEHFADSNGGLRALRTLRLFRVVNKLANRISSLKVLLKAMVLTGISLKYWLVLFLLVLYICTLMYMEFFANTFQFVGPDGTDSLAEVYDHGDGAPKPWCNGTDDGRSWHFRQDCIPRAHFDTFPWAFVTVYQIMTGENWNTIMYAGMRARGWPFAVIFLLLILFGQTLFLSLFLSMLMSKFDEVQDEMEEEEAARNLALKLSMERRHSRSWRNNSLLSFRNFLSTNSSPQAADDSMLSGAEGSLVAQPCEVDLDTGSKDQKRQSWDPNDVEEKSIDEEEPEKPKWPYGYALFLLHETNPVRKFCRWVVESDISFGDFRCKAFDNLILLCILLSSLCMAIDSPLSNPDNDLIRVIRGADDAFAVVFIIEMVMKLCAYGLAWAPEAYLKSGWNWLDGIVVLVSIMGFITKDGPSFLKTLRILRAFRPLRVISRNENLKVVVQTVFAAIPDLGTLVFVSFLFLLIFALIFIMYLADTFRMCTDADGGSASGVSYLRDAGDTFRTPMCLADAPVNATNLESLDGIFSIPRGSWDDDRKSWTMGSCSGSHPVEWRRASSDTPMCVARCDPFLTSGEGAAPSWLCPPRYTETEQLPSACDNPLPNRAYVKQEEVGDSYTAAMQRALVLPCAGTMVDVGLKKVVTPSPGLSCRETFCPGGASSDVQESCRDNCKIEPYMCKDACAKGSEDTLACQSCLRECEAACECDFCEPLVWDAAVCVEQGNSWDEILSQNFNNIWNAMVTLFEISTTEGWVDVMYAATDASEKPFVQPVRDQNMAVWPIFFVVWIFVSFMFLINLAVGVIVDKYMDLKKAGQKTFRSEAQEKWVAYRRGLESRNYYFIMTNLSSMPAAQRAVYDIISSSAFENSIMTAIVVMTIFMGCQIYPAPTTWWVDALVVINYVFAGIFTIEAILKLFALRRNYFLDNWNRFDFACVAATIVGIVLKEILDLEVAGITSVIRIFRIARLFRLLRFLRGLNRLFMALIISLPSLANVVIIWLLLLTLFAILGVNLFSTVSTDNDTHNVHGNFRNFFWAFTTLFRASTGEAWNEVMHDLAKTESDYFREGSWCTPSELFDWQFKYDVLMEKCLIDKPNACVQTFWGWNPWPVFYWVLFILIIAHMIMNLVITVILDGYEEGKLSPEGEIIDICLEVWKRYDPDLSMQLPFHEATLFINEALQALACRTSRTFNPFAGLRHCPGDEYGVDIAVIPMKLARLWDLRLSDNRWVTFVAATRQVLRFCILDGDTSCITDLEAIDREPQRVSMLKKTVSRLSGTSSNNSKDEKEPPVDPCDLKSQIAARKVIRAWRENKMRKAVEAAQARAAMQSRQDKENAHGNDNLRAAGVSRFAVEPPIAG